MKSKSTGQPSAAKAPAELIQTIPVEIDGNVNADSNVVLSPTTLANASAFVEQAATYESELMKHVVSTASIMCNQGRLVGKAKKLLRNEGANDEKIDNVVDNLCLKFGLAPSTLNRRIQMWDQAVYLEIIDLELQLKIEKSPTLTPELLAEMEARIGSISGTQFMRHLGMLPAKEKKPKVVKTGKTLKDRLDEKSAQVETLLAEIKQLLADKDLRSGVKDTKALESLQAGYSQMEHSVTKFKSLAIDLSLVLLPDSFLPKSPDLGLGEIPELSLVSPTGSAVPLLPS